LTGFSRHTPCRLSSRGMTASATAEASPTHRATRIQPQHGTAINAEAITSQRCKLFSLDDDGGWSDSDPDPSDDDGCSSEDEQRRSHTSKHSRWSDLDEQRLLAYKLDPQFVHAGTWSGPEATKLPPAGGQAVAQALCAYLSFDICWDECLRKTLSFCRPVHRGSRYSGGKRR
jgi:hypothetical protein